LKQNKQTTKKKTLKVQRTVGGTAICELDEMTKKCLKTSKPDQNSGLLEVQK
jgi:hypothetical protein